MQEQRDYDVIVIGGGSGGHAAAKRASKSGARTALIEGAKDMGGLCILRGCMPTKTNIETANRMRAIREAKKFGIEVGAPKLLPDVLKERRERLVDGFQFYRVKGMEGADYTLLRGVGTFTGPHSVRFQNDETDVELTAGAFVISTGSDERLPDIDGLPDVPYWTSDEAIDLPYVPKHIIIYGSGAIGMETCDFFSGLGLEVTLVTHSKRLLNKTEPEISDAILKQVESRGVKVYMNGEFRTVSHDGEIFTLNLEFDDEREDIVLKGDAFLCAIGRVPRVKALALEKLDPVYAEERLEIDKFARTRLPHVFAAGDCASPLALVHLAVMQGDAAGQNAAAVAAGQPGNAQKTWPDKLPLLGVFTDPETVHVGTTTEEAEKEGIEVVSAICTYDDMGKGEIVGEEYGLVKLLADRSTGKLIAACGYGPHVIDYCHSMVLAIHQGLTVEQILEIPWYHPTLGEIWSYAAEDLLEELESD